MGLDLETKGAEPQPANGRLCASTSCFPRLPSRLSLHFAFLVRACVEEREREGGSEKERARARGREARVFRIETNMTNMYSLPCSVQFATPEP